MRRFCANIQPMTGVLPEIDLSARRLFEIVKVDHGIPERDPHRHRYYEMVWVESGDGTHAVDFVDGPLAPNLVFGDVTADVIAFAFDDGRGSIRDSDPLTTDFSFFVATDGTGAIVSWSAFAESQEDLGGQVRRTHQIVTRTGGSALDRGILRLRGVLLGP